MPPVVAGSLFDALPSDVQLAIENYQLWRRDPHHPSLHFRRLHGSADCFSVRVGDRYRVLGTLDLAPDFAEAHADLGGYYLNLWTAGMRPAEELVPLVRTQARKTVELPGAVGHVLWGVLAAAFDYDWKEAELHFGLFLASGESKEEARATCANYYFSPFGRIHEAVENAGEDGRPVKFTGIEFNRAVNGRLVEHWSMFDNLALLQQIGAMPA